MKKKPIALNEIVPSKTYMVKSRNGEFMPVTVVCDFTKGWLRGWVKLDLDPLWNASEKLFIHVKPVDPTLREIAIPVTRQCDEIVCYSSTNGVTLFDYEEGWAQQRMREVQAMMKELQGKLEWLSMVEGEKHETRIQRQLILNTRALY
jgi:hypothetical protein